MPLFERSQKKYSNDIPKKSFAEELGNKFHLTSVQSVPRRGRVKLEQLDEDGETEN